MRFFSRLFIPHKNRPAFWKEYKRQVVTEHASGQPLKDVRFVVFDTETTGLEPAKDRILSIGAVGIQQGKIMVQDSFEMYVQQETYSKESISIHGIMPGRARQGVPEQEAVQRFIDYIRGAVLVAHHAAFDVTMVNNMIKRHYHARILNKFLDTASLAIRLEQFQVAPEFYQSSEYSLDALIERYHLTAQDRHTAAGDSFITAQLLIKLLDRAQKRGILTLKDLLR